MGKPSLPEGLLKFYLEKYRFSSKKDVVCFKNVSKGVFDITVKKDEHDRDVTTYKQTVDMAMAFDYDLLTTHYNINLEVSDIFAQDDEFKDK